MKGNIQLKKPCSGGTAYSSSVLASAQTFDAKGLRSAALRSHADLCVGVARHRTHLARQRPRDAHPAYATVARPRGEDAHWPERCDTSAPSCCTGDSSSSGASGTYSSSTTSDVRGVARIGSGTSVCCFCPSSSSPNRCNRRRDSTNTVATSRFGYELEHGALQW